MEVKNKLNKSGFISIIEGFNETKQDNIIDLSNIKFADVFGIVSLILLLKKEKNNGNQIELILPKDFNVANYLHISGFINYVKNMTSIKYKALNYLSKFQGKIDINNNKDYMPIQLVNSTDDIENIVRNVKEWLKNKKIPEITLGRIVTLLSELLDNALHHSNTEIGCVFMMQKYKSKVMISVADFGVGIKESLEKNKKYEKMFVSNTDAMQYIFTDKNYISSIDEKGRGNGFWTLNELSKENKMEFYICSREGFYSLEYRDGKNYREAKKIYDLYGTHVNFCINCIDNVEE